MIYSYLLPANLLTLIALLLGLHNFSRGRHSWRLLPLFLLVISQLLGLIVILVLPKGQPMTGGLAAAIQIFSTACLIWALLDPSTPLPLMGQSLAWLGGGIALLLSILPLVPRWPIPFHFHSLIIALGGAFLLALSRRSLLRLSLGVALIIATAHFLGLLGLMTRLTSPLRQAQDAASIGSGDASGQALFWLGLWLGYGLFIVTLHREGLELQRGQHSLSTPPAQEALNLSQEKQRLLEVSEIISTVPGLEQSLDHVVRSLAHITHTDQVAIFVTMVGDTLQGYLAALYDSQGRLDSPASQGRSFLLGSYLPLQIAMMEQQPLLLPSPDNSELINLYSLWGEAQTGPTLIQPLVVQGRSIGVLLLGNPVTQRAIRESDQRLCRSLAAQVAVMAEAQRHYAYLKSQTDAVETVKTQAPADLTLSPEAKGEAEFALEGALGAGPELQPVPALSTALPLINKPQQPASEPAMKTVPGGVATLALPQTLVEDEVSSTPEESTLILPVRQAPPSTGPLRQAQDAASTGSGGSSGGASGRGFDEPRTRPRQTQGATQDRPETAEPGREASASATAGATDEYLSILENVEEGVVVGDVRGRVKLVNKAAERLLGKHRRDLLGQPIGTIYGKINSTEAIEKLAAAFSRRNEPLPTFFEDEERAIQGRLTPWRSQTGEWLGIIAVFRDVTPQVKADRARHHFVTALSRVLRGPLTLIKGYTELITNGSIENYTPEQLQVQRIIHSSAEQVVEVLDNAVQISTEDKGKRLPRFETVEAPRVIQEALQQCTPLAQLRRLELIREISSDLPPVVLDPKHFYRILENLLSNACRFTPPGGQVRVSAWMHEEREGNITRPHLLLTVADNGVGISKAEQKRIFEPFYQLNNQRPDTESGMGMGLAVVKELVELHNGRVWVESTPGEGSAFYVLLPVTQA